MNNRKQYLVKQILLEEASNAVPTVNEIRFFLNQFCKGNINDAKYRQSLVDTFINKIYLYDDKMTVLYNTQDSHSEVTIDDKSLSRVGLVEPRGIDYIMVSIPSSRNRATVHWTVAVKWVRFPTSPV